MMKAEVVQMKLQLLGQIRKVTVATGDSDEVNKTKHRAATAPNLIHSLDASLLHLSALRFDAPISLIHDSVLCRATDMSALSSIVRETYMHLFAESSYLEEWGKQIGAETKPPIIGDLAPESVIESTYFFC
jgi:DNA-directed RNA polymerase